MRGEPVSRSAQKLDVVLVAARYDPQTLKLDFAQGYVRRGKVWGDQKLLGRGEILEHLSRGKLVVAGHLAGIPGDFIVHSRVRAEGAGEGQVLHSEGSQAAGDHLGIPLV